MGGVWDDVREDVVPDVFEGFVLFWGVGWERVEDVAGVGWGDWRVAFGVLCVVCDESCDLVGAGDELFGGHVVWGGSWCLGHGDGGYSPMGTRRACRGLSVCGLGLGSGRRWACGMMVLGVLLFLVSASVWLRGVFWLDSVEWRFIRSEASVDAPGTFDVRSRSYSLMSYSPSVRLTVSTYTSFLNTAEMRDQWLSSRGWQGREVRRAVDLRDEPDGWWFWKGCNNWRSKKAGAGWYTGGRQGVTSRVLELPLWGGVLLGSVLAFVGWRWRRRIRRRELGGACHRCGYDLRGIRRGPTSGCVCPECGAAVEVAGGDCGG